jgi:GLPGLI family protein
MKYKQLIQPFFYQWISSKTISRLVLLLILLSGLGTRGIAQQNEGAIYYRVVSDRFLMWSSLEFYNKENAEKDKFIYGNNVSTSYARLYFNQLKTKYINRNETDTIDNLSEPFALTDLPGRKLTLYTHINGKNYIIKDTLQAPDWNILNDIKEVAGHICASASTFDSVRKQKVNAWFALDIPISIGPDRWYGLPGAILEVDLNDGALVISTDKIEFCKLTTQLDAPKKSKGKVIAQKRYNEIFRKFYARCVYLRQGYYYMAPY